MFISSAFVGRRMTFATETKRHTRLSILILLLAIKNRRVLALPYDVGLAPGGLCSARPGEADQSPWLWRFA